MKKVVFICLLSLTTCLSRPDGAPGVPLASAIPSTATTTVAHESTGTLLSKPTSKLDPTIAEVPAVPKSAESISTASTTVTNPPTTPVVTENATKTDTNKTTDKKETSEKPKIEPTKVTTKTDAETPQPTPATTNATKPEDKSGNKTETTTLKPNTTAPTVAPKDVPHQQARAFDGPSFIGGIILTLGLLAIGFMGFKYYKNQTERNYHTL